MVGFILYLFSLISEHFLKSVYLDTPPKEKLHSGINRAALVTHRFLRWSETQYSPEPSCAHIFSQLSIKQHSSYLPGGILQLPNQLT